MSVIKIIGFLLIILSVVTCGKQEVFESDWDEDIYFFGKELEDKHKDLFTKISKQEFDENIDALRQKVDSLTTAEIKIELLKILNKIGDSHTSIQVTPSISFYPISFEWLEDGLFISEIDARFEPYIGKKINSINGTNIDAISEQYRELLTHENESQFKVQFEIFLFSPEILKYYNIIESLDSMVVSLEQEGDIVIYKSFNGFSSFYNLPGQALYLSDIDNNYWRQILASDSTLYVQYNRAAEKPGSPFSSFSDGTLSDIDANDDIKKVVIDLRLNSGGNSGIFRPLIDGLSDRINSGRLLSSDIFVVIGRHTFSSALLNALELQDRLDPILLGEPTGGKPNHFGEVKSFMLPNSQILVWYSSKYFEIVDGDPESLVPDTPINISSDDFFNNTDPILEFIISN